MFKSLQFVKLILHYSMHCKFAVVEQLYAIMRNYEQPNGHSHCSASICDSRTLMLSLVCAKILWQARDFLRLRMTQDLAPGRTR